MTILFTAFFTVLILLAVALAGFILRKKNMVDDGCIPGFSRVLLYICQPCLAIYTFSEVQRGAAAIGSFLAEQGFYGEPVVIPIEGKRGGNARGQRLIKQFSRHDFIPLYV